jgi:hypothetical protein
MYRAVLEAVSLPPALPSPEPELESRGNGVGGKLSRALTLAPGTLPLLGGALLAGGLVGAAVFATVGPVRVRVVYVDRPVPMLVASSSSSASAESSPSVAVAEPTHVRPAASSGLGPGLQSGPSSSASMSSSRAKSTESPLSRERTLLDRARQHLARGEAAAALDVVDAHEREFSRGKLEEEREALAIRALLSLGRVEAARERGARFAARFPGSLMAPALEPALSSP